MPFPVGISGAFEYRSVERALGIVRARQVERYENEVLFIGPAVASDPWSPPLPWKPDPASVLAAAYSIGAEGRRRRV